VDGPDLRRKPQRILCRKGIRHSARREAGFLNGSQRAFFQAHVVVSSVTRRLRSHFRAGRCAVSAVSGWGCGRTQAACGTLVSASLVVGLREVPVNARWRRPMKLNALGLAGVAVALFAIPAIAHHSFAMFDAEKVKSLE